MVFFGICIVGFGTLIAAVLFHWLFHLVNQPANLPPGPLPLPLIGNAYLFFFRRVPDVFDDLKRNYGNVVTLYIGHSFRTVVFLGYHPLSDVFAGEETAKIVADRPGAHNELRGVQRGITWAGWPEVKERRRFVLRAFKDNGLCLTNMGEHVYEELSSLVGHLDKTAGQEVDIGTLLTTHLISCVLQTIYSQRFDLSQERSAILYKHGKVFFESTILRHFLAPYLSFILPDRVSIAERKMEAEMAAWLKPELEKRRANFDSSHCVDFVDAYLASELDGSAMPFQAFNRILVDLFIAGMESLAETTNWAVYYLAHMPDEQDRLRKEIDAIIPQTSWPKLEHRSKMVRLEAFFNEVHRHSNRMEVLLLRATTKELRMDCHKVSGIKRSYVVPAHTAVMFSQVPSNMDQEYWLDPENFRVDRWLTPDGTLKRHDYFLPFGLGKRSCVGEQPARGLMFLLMSTLLQRFSWRLAVPKLSLTDCDDSGVNRNAPRNYKLIMTARF